MKLPKETVQGYLGSHELQKQRWIWLTSYVAGLTLTPPNMESGINFTEPT